jgi:hypothetical protein
MTQSPIFSRSYDFLLWLIPQANKFPRYYRFTLAHRVQTQALGLHETLIEAGLGKGHQRSTCLQTADRQLALLRHTVRLCSDLGLLTLEQYQCAAEHLSEIGRLLGGWMKMSAPVNVP